MAKKKCSICGHPEAGAISAALESGMRQQDVAQQFRVSKFAISRHSRKCLASPVATGETTNDQLDRWLRRADDLYMQAGVNGDVRSQVSALSAAVRSLQSAQRHEAKRQEQSEKQNPSGHLQVEHLDEIVHKYLESCGDDRCFRCGAPCTNGVFTGGPVMPGTFPDLIAQQSEPMEN